MCGAEPMGIWRRAPPAQGSGSRSEAAGAARAPPPRIRRGRLDVSDIGSRQGARTRAFLGGGAGEAGARGAEGPPTNLKPRDALPVISTRVVETSVPSAPGRGRV